jgi:hypothetical protein
MSSVSREPISFHPNVGDNIELEDGGFTARRKGRGAHTTVFSSRPLEPGETFAVRIESYAVSIIQAIGLW